ncbi:hypothetical protein [Nocardiopsis sp. ATB16-24]|uniref:hypothetical protein n=1 Tax=Nocardiopsis sp. ATB16-24 TaxID=3019555 RepID=UPI0025540B30|nr:hypothetical protein [Nocardiopsis sp. ATB16-24]
MVEDEVAGCGKVVDLFFGEIRADQDDVDVFRYEFESFHGEVKTAVDEAHAEDRLVGSV